jgi:hypothetical protein
MTYRIHTQTHRLMGGIYEVTEMVSSTMTDMPIFIKFGSLIQKLTGDTQIRRHTDTKIGWRPHKPTFNVSKYGK